MPPGALKAADEGLVTQERDVDAEIHYLLARRGSEKF
jgi:hypothetical protein